MSEEFRKAAVLSCEYSEQNPVYCQQCGGHEHLCRKPLNTEGLTAYFDQMATDGRVETTVQWLVEISLLIQSDVEKRLKHTHAAPMIAHKCRRCGAEREDGRFEICCM